MNPPEPEKQSSSLTGKAKEVAHQAADKVRESKERAKEVTAEFADDRKQSAADRIGAVGSTLHRSAEATRREDPNIAWLTEQASARLQHAADYVRNSSWSQLRNDGASLARRHPAVFFGGMFALGAAAGAILKAGTPSDLAGADAEDDDIPAGEPADDGNPEMVPAAADEPLTPPSP